MTPFTRRGFLGASMAGAGALAMPSLARAGANDQLRVGVVGVKGRGLSHVGGWAKSKDSTVAAICDIDENIIEPAMKMAEKASGTRPVYYKDIRKMLEDKSIDAVSIATCNHTHTLNALWAVQAGKHVYVEKPLSHNVWEGRKLVEAARKYNRIVQHGTQSRSSGGCRKTAAFLGAGKLGRISVSRGLCYKRRTSIGKTPESPVPEGVDYDIWLGPAPVRPFTKNRFHYNWHWMWDTGNGDIGNQGIHEMDKARWYLGKNVHPNKVVAIGGRFGYEDDGETPNTMVAVADYGDALLLFEVRGLETEAYLGEKIGNVVHAEKGRVSGTTAYDPEGKKIAMDVPDDGRAMDHFENFLKACKAENRELLNADVLEGHLSCSLVHLANISYRLGEQRPIEKDDPFVYAEGNEAFRRMRDHLKANNVDLSKTQLTVGRTVTFDGATEKCVGDPEADKLLTREYRKPFVVPENP
jgi:predicted dehydrogenase